MKILQIGKFYSPAKGGIETVVKTLAQGLQAHGQEVSVLCANQGAHSVEEEVENIPVRRLACYGKWFSQPLTPSLGWTLRQLSQEFDLFHLHLPNPLAEFFALFLPTHLPLVATYHADVTRQQLLLPLYLPLLRRFLHRTRKIIVPTQSHIDYSPVLSPWPKKQVSVIPFGISNPFRSVARDELAAQLQQRHGRFALFVGRHVEYKGIAYLIEAMERISQQNTSLRLVILGDGPLRSELTLLVKQRGLDSRIHLQAQVSQDLELQAHYQACEFLVLPSVSREEAFGMVLLEAMSFGKPLISTQLNTGIREINLDGVTGRTVPPRDAAALAQAMLYLHQSESIRQTLGQAAQARFLEYFTDQAMTRSHLQLYSDVLARNSS